MKKFIFMAGAVIIVGLIVWSTWFFLFSKSLQNNTVLNSGTLPSGASPASQSQAQNAAIASVQSISSQKNPEVARDFLNAIQNSNQITLGGTVVMLPYALQIWGDINKGGEALLKYASSTGWTLVSLGGGEWTMSALMQDGVPRPIAERLVAGLTDGMSPAVSTSTILSGISPITIPEGDTIIIGTSKGSVSMNNFYKNADYITQDQQTVVIQQTSTYSVNYTVFDSSFTIGILSVQFSAARQTAETAFLSSLGISKIDACKLKVHENIPAYVSVQYAGKAFPLSFCVSSTFGQ